VLLREPALTPAQVEDALQEANDLGFSQIWLHESCQIRDQTLQIPHTGRHLRAASPLPTRGPFGRSCHDEVELDACFAAGARYATLSPIWHPTSKPDDHRPEIGLFRLLTAARGRPVLALGGIDPSRLAQLARAGAWGAAILGPFRSAGPETTAAAQAMLGAWTESRPHPG
jgi:thiamine-phosphate pyrophosphorylase